MVRGGADGPTGLMFERLKASEAEMMSLESRLKQARDQT